MIGFVEIFLLYFYFHHHLHWCRYVLSVVVTFECLLETKKSLNYLELLVVNQSFVVVRSWWRIAFDLSAKLKILQSHIDIALLEIDYPPLLDTNMPHISIATSRQSLNSLLVMPQFFLAHSFANIGKSFGFIDTDSLWKIFKRVEIAIFLEMQFSPIDQTVIIIWIQLQPLIQNLYRLVVFQQPFVGQGNDQIQTFLVIGVYFKCTVQLLDPRIELVVIN